MCSNVNTRENQLVTVEVLNIQTGRITRDRLLAMVVSPYACVCIWKQGGSLCFSARLTMHDICMPITVA